MAEAKREYFAVYTRDSDGFPVAVFDSHDGAQAYRKRTFIGADADGTLVLPARDLGQSSDAKDMLHPEAPPTVSDTDDPDARLRAEIRAQLEQDERRARLTDEVKQEMAAERKESASPDSRREAASAE